MIVKFRKTALVEAEQWFPGDHVEGVKHGKPPASTGPAIYYVKTLEGWHEVSYGDWIITGVNGEKWPCKPDIFEKTYERVDEGDGEPT